MSSTRTLIVFCTLVAAIAAQCGTSDHPNCATWQRNGQFCTNEARPVAVRQQYCPITCGNLGCPGAATTTAKPGSGAENANCAKWAANPSTPFCVSTMTVAQKTLYCPTTCAFEIKPTADCALYTVSEKTSFARGTPSNKTSPEKVVASGAVATKTTVSRAYAGTGCTVKLFVDATPTDLTKPTVSFVGTSDAHFFTVADANNAALSYSCTCV